MSYLYAKAYMAERIATAEHKRFVADLLENQPESPSWFTRLGDSIRASMPRPAPALAVVADCPEPECCAA